LHSYLGGEFTPRARGRTQNLKKPEIDAQIYSTRTREKPEAKQRKNKERTRKEQGKNNETRRICSLIISRQTLQTCT
jgi:hypothetical protein